MKYKGETITLSKAKSFLEGNILFQSDKLFNILPLYKKEQVYYRNYICRDCLLENKCRACGCDLPERFYVDKKYETRKCKYPDFMDKKAWQEFKLTNKIRIDEVIKQLP